MNLVLHQFRKDARQFRVLLMIWFGLVLLDLAVNLGWIGRVYYTEAEGFDHAANAWTSTLPIVIWALVGVVSSLVVVGDSPARREGFLATRPLAKRDLLLAKFLFVLVLIVAPWTLQETIHLTLQQVPAWVIARGSVERLMIVLPVAIGAGAYAALWSSYARWARSVAIAVVGFYLLIGVAAMVKFYVFNSRSFSVGTNLSAGMAATWVLTISLAVLAAWHSRAPAGWRARWSGLALVALLFYLVLVNWRWDFFALRPADSAAANSVMAQAGFEIPSRGIILQTVEQPGRSPQTQFNLLLSPQTKPLPPGEVVEFDPKEATLLRASGGELRPGGKSASRLFPGNNWNRSFTTADYVSWSSEFPEDVMFRENGGSYGTPAAVFTTFRLPGSRAELAESLTLKASLEARVFRWRKIAELPLQRGAGASDEFGSWTFTAAHQNPGAGMVELLFERREIELATATDSRCSTAQDGPLSRMAFLVYDPEWHVALIPDQYTFRNITRGAHTALVQYYNRFTVTATKPFNPAELARCRLIIFEKTWTGSVTETTQSASFTIDEKLLPRNVSLAGNNKPLPRDEFKRRVAALKRPAPDATRREVGLYVLEFLRLVDAQVFVLEPRDPLVEQLAQFVPAHLDLFLDGLPAMSSASARTVLNAIKIGAAESQKNAIITTLPRQPELAEVILARGWMDEAREQIYETAKSARELPIAAERAIAWFHDPATYPRLLQEFERHPSDEEDNFLHALGLEQQLDSIVENRWRAQSLVLHQPGWEMFDEVFTLALRHGQMSALKRAFLLLDHPEISDDTNDGFGFASAAMRGAISLSDLKTEDRYNLPSVVEWLKKHRAEDFVFNTARRQFVLKENGATNQTASAQKP